MKKVVLQTTATPTTARSILLSTVLRAALLVAVWAVPTAVRGQIFVTQTDATGRIPVIGEYTTAGTVVNQALISAGFGGPPWSGVTLSGTNLFVIEFTGIGKYTTAGATVNASFLPGSIPVAIAVSDDGATLFVADSSGTIGAYDAESGAAVNRTLITGLAAISGTIISAPTGIAVSGLDLYVVHPGLAAGLGNIGKYTTAGATVNASLITGLTWPQNIAVSGANLYVTMGRQTGSVGKFTTAGATVNGSLAVVNGYPQGIAISGANLFVVHDYNNQVSEFTLSGDTVHDPLLMTLGGAQGIAVAPDLAVVSYGLTLNSDPPAGGSITADPAPDADGMYAPGTAVQLTAITTEDANSFSEYYLDSWSGVDSYYDDTAQLIISGPRSVTAKFVEMFNPLGLPPCLAEALQNLFSSPVTLKDRSREKTAGISSPSAPLDLNLIRMFRDQVLAQSSRGQSIIALYNRFSPEAVYHCVQNPQLRSAAVQAIVGLQPLMQDMMAGSGQLVVSSNQMSLLSAFVSQLSASAGLELKAAIQRQSDQMSSLDMLIGKSTAEVRQMVLGIQLQIVNPRMNTNGVEFTLTGVLPPGTLHLESSGNLTNWQAIGSPVVTNLPANLHDDQPLATNQRYYRVIVQP